MATAPQNITLGELAQAAIAQYLKHTVAHQQPVLADADPEDLHQMRVGLRRLRTAVQVFEAGLDLPQRGREPKIAALGRKLGQLRDLDVTRLNLCDRYAPDLPPEEHQYLGLVLLHLAKQRHKTFKRVKRLLKGKRYGKLTQALTDWVKNPSYRAIAALPADQVMPDLVLPLVSQLWLHPGWLVGIAPDDLAIQSHLSPAAAEALIADQGPVLHSLRKQVKRVRYQLRLVADLYPGALEDDIQRLSALQDTLGTLQDSTVLEDFIAAAVPDAKAQMPQLFALLADHRHHAWKQWQGHQKHYLDTAQRQRLRLALLYPGDSAAHAQNLQVTNLQTPAAEKTPPEAHNSTGPQPRRRAAAKGKAAGKQPSRHQPKTKAKTKPKSSSAQAKTKTKDAADDL